jgi:hypothetical protein
LVTHFDIGEQLETIDKHRSRAEESKDLIQYFLEFNRGSCVRLDGLRRESSDGEQKTAIIARRLNTIAKEIDLPGTDAARATIEKYCEGFEKSLLVQFDQVYNAGDRGTMNVDETDLAYSQNVDSFQWRKFLRTNICESTSVLHQFVEDS